MARRSNRWRRGRLSAAIGLLLGGLLTLVTPFAGLLPGLDVGVRAEQPAAETSVA